jgi:ubiquinone biosynthesis protein UbiJ
VWSFRDVSELRRTQAALREALERLERRTGP